MKVCAKMSDPQTQTEPLIRHPSHQTAINVGAPAVGGSSFRTYKMAGLTLFACLLIAGQAVTAYYLLSQKSEIRSLEDQSNNLKNDLKRGGSAAVHMQIHMPVNIMSKLTDDSAEDTKGASTEAPGERPASEQPTQCQLEAAGLKPVKLPVRPVCDEQGRYRPQQCWMENCWCVDSASGQEIPGSLHQGQDSCGAAGEEKLIGRLGGLMAPPDVMQLSDD